MAKSKITKRVEAEQRQAVRAYRTNQEQLAKLDAGGFAAKREREKLRNELRLPDIDYDDDIQRQKDKDHMNR